MMRLRCSVFALASGAPSLLLRNIFDLRRPLSLTLSLRFFSNRCGT